MAAQVAENVLRQHEQLVSVLPTHIKALLPQLVDLTTPHRHADEQAVSLRALADQSRVGGSTPSRPTWDLDAAFTFGAPTQLDSHMRSPPADLTERRLFRTVRSGDSSRPYPEHHARQVFRTPAHQRSNSYAEIAREEADDRLVLLERALSEARENEDVQRKVAARLRRDFDKLQREFELAEQAKEHEESGQAPTSQPGSSAESMTSSQFDSWAWKQRSLEEENTAEEGRMLRPGGGRVKLRIKPKVAGQRDSRRPSRKSEGTEVVDEACDSNESGWGLTRFPEFPAAQGSGTSGSRPTDVEDRLTRLPPRPTYGRLKAQLRYTSPKKSSPTHRRQASEIHASDRYRSVSPTRPEKEVQPTMDGVLSPGQHATPQSRYGSLTSHMASVRKYMSASVRSAAALGRSLGSELGSEYGDSDVEEEHDDTFTRDTLVAAGPSNSSQDWHEETGYRGIGSHTRLVPIPSTASSGLPSLALALGPTSPPPVPNSTRSTRQHRFNQASRPGSKTKRSSSPTTPLNRRKRSPARLSGSPASRSRDNGDPGSYRPKKGRSNWIRPLLLPRAQGLKPDSTRRRPGLHPRSCSDGALAFAHRQYVSEVGTVSAQMLREVASARMNLDSIASSATMLSIDSRQELERALMRERDGHIIPRLELYSPPARLVNDLIILLSILLEWIEIFVVIVWRVTLAVRYGRRSIL